jgi:tRNA(His) 5'-end guanylyltransferase
MNDEFGDRMKMFEKVSAQRVMPLLPTVARLDGKCFSNFTKGLKRPYDERMSKLMSTLTKILVEETNALMGYTQSDEITLLWYSDNIKKQIFFDGKIQKMISILSALTSVAFNKGLQMTLPEKANESPIFDCRIWQVPNKVEAANVFLWREQDATKNSISMAASHYYSHNQLMNCTGNQKQDMLHEKGINWNDYPSFFKRGIFFQRRHLEIPFTTEEIEKLPEKHEARTNPNVVMNRSTVNALDMPPFNQVINRVAVIFDGAEPTTL